jgi:hypothetical protein
MDACEALALRLLRHELSQGLQFIAPQWCRETVHLKALQLADLVNATFRGASSPS